MTPRISSIARHQPRQIGSCAERPFVGDTHEVDAAHRVIGLQLFEQRLYIGILRQTLGERRHVERLGGGEQHRFQKTQLLRTHSRLG
jgi:hypothetical protein